jgi:nascent polypeptide-associated complex subunit alpha
MFPGIGGMNPKKMQGMMKQLGINQEEIDSGRVIIEKKDGSKIIINNPSVQKITMQGQESFQISGDITEEGGESFSEEDVKTVMEKTGCEEKRAREVLESVDGDLAEAIMELTE